MTTCNTWGLNRAWLNRSCSLTHKALSSYYSSYRKRVLISLRSQPLTAQGVFVSNGRSTRRREHRSVDRQRELPLLLARHQSPLPERLVLRRSHSSARIAMNKEVRAGSERGRDGNGERNEYVRTRIDVARVIKAINGQRTSRETGRAILAFIATVAVAWLMRWEAGDLMWGAWASSLSFGYVYALVLILARPEEVDAPAGLAQPGRILAMIAFFTFTFGLFHLWQGVVLNLVFPISEREGLGILLSPAGTSSQPLSFLDCTRSKMQPNHPRIPSGYCGRMSTSSACRCSFSYFCLWKRRV